MLSDEECVAVRLALYGGIERVAGTGIYEARDPGEFMPDDPHLVQAILDLRARAGVAGPEEVPERAWASDVSIERTGDPEVPLIATMTLFDRSGNALPVRATWAILDQGGTLAGPHGLFFTSTLRSIDPGSARRSGSMVDLSSPWSRRGRPAWAVEVQPTAPPSPALRSQLEGLVERLVQGDVAGLVRDGMVFGVDEVDDVGWIESIEAQRHPLAPLPAGEWLRRARVLGDESADGWVPVEVDLWDRSGPSELTLEVDVHRSGTVQTVFIQNVHVQ
jgi:hypothetical protein